MSSPANGINSHNYGIVQYRPSGYPVSTDSQVLHVHSVQPANQQWDNSSPPPAYDTLDRMTTWNEENSYLNTPPTTQIWIRRAEINVPPTSQVSNMPPSVQQTSCQLCNTPSISPELSELSTLSHQNSYTVRPQRTDFKQQFRNFRPTALGIFLIIVSILEFSLGISVAFSLYNHGMKSLLYGTLFWVPGFHVFAGTMLIVSWANTSTCSVKCVLCISILSFIASVVGLAFASYDLHDLRCISSGHLFICRIIYEKEIKIYCCLIGLNVLALFLSFFTSCIGNVTLGLKTRSPPTYAITVMPR